VEPWHRQGVHPPRVVVVGAGPAGSAAALAIRRALPATDVLVLDKHPFPRDKACGDGVSDHVLDVLKELDVGGLLKDREPAESLELGTAACSTTRKLRRPLFGVPRKILDARLLSAAEKAGARFEQRQVRSIRSAHERVVIDDEVEADLVIAADGVESIVRREIGIPANGSGHMAIAIRGYTPSLSAHARLVSYGRDWPAYAWEFPLGDGDSNVGYGEVLRDGKHLTRAWLLERLEGLMPGATAEAHDWRAARIPLSTQRPRQPDGRVLLAGDAASLVNPMSGEGIWYAVKSGMLAGQAVVHGSNAGAWYRDQLDRAFGRHLRHANFMARVGQIGASPSLGTRMTVVDEDFFYDQVSVSIGGGTYRWPVAVRALAKAVMQPHPGHRDLTTAATT
jgi:geranylgeranyl reductase family protein